ncbi:MAG: hypothetical protein ACD_28C00189G0002 [uncultured bacterium]|nr:MAG: hypothetical protein ACD_28C00189G0002 [uncultured bacterium]
MVPGKFTVQQTVPLKGYGMRVLRSHFQSENVKTRVFFPSHFFSGRDYFRFFGTFHFGLLRFRSFRFNSNQLIPHTHGIQITIPHTKSLLNRLQRGGIIGKRSNNHRHLNHVIGKLKRNRIGIFPSSGNQIRNGIAHQIFRFGFRQKNHSHRNSCRTLQGKIKIIGRRIRIDFKLKIAGSKKCRQMLLGNRNIGKWIIVIIISGINVNIGIMSPIFIRGRNIIPQRKILIHAGHVQIIGIFQNSIIRLIGIPNIGDFIGKITVNNLRNKGPIVQIFGQKNRPNGRCIFK